MNTHTHTARPLASKLFWGLALAMFFVMLLLNCLTPLVADDYTFAFSYLTGERLQNLGDVLASQYHHYFTWSGRFIIKCLAQWFTIPPKLVFNLCNAAVYTGLGLLIYWLAKGRRRARDPLLLLLLIFLSLWEISPVFGQTNLWMCGSCNYLWASFFCLAALLPFGLYLHAPFAPRRWLPFACFAAGLAAGWSSENTSAGLLVALVLAVGFVLYTEKRAPLWMWADLGGALIGFSLLILAPGNYLRQDAAADPRGPWTILAVRLLTALDQLWTHGGVLLVLFALLYCLLWLQKPGGKALFWPAALLLAGLAANFAMIASPVYYDRSTHGVFTFLTLACAACAAQLTLPGLRRGLACFAAAIFVVAGVHLVQATYDISSFYTMRKVREALLLEQKAAGVLDIETYSIETYTRWCAGHGLPDLREDPTDWVCADTARYYGLNRLWAAEAHTYPFPGQTNSAYEKGLPDGELSSATGLS